MKVRDLINPPPPSDREEAILRLLSEAVDCDGEQIALTIHDIVYGLEKSQIPTEAGGMLIWFLTDKVLNKLTGYDPAEALRLLFPQYKKDLDSLVKQGRVRYKDSYYYVPTS